MKDVFVYVILLTLIIFVSLIHILQKVSTPTDIQLDDETHLLQLILDYNRNPNNTPLSGFTRRRRQVRDELGDVKFMYDNYYLDPPASSIIQTDLANVKINYRLEDTPINVDGTLFQIADHGTITPYVNANNDNVGFTVSGIVEPFVCPDVGNYYWDNETCKQISPCKQEKNIAFPFVKGIPSHNKYHEKLYLDCLSETKMKLQTCPPYKTFNQMRIQPSSDIPPCSNYDICITLGENNIHGHIVSSDDVLGINEYYVCRDGKSVKMKCNGNKIFDNELQQCLEKNLCENVPVGYTKSLGSTSFIVCTGIDPDGTLVRCGYGVDIYTNENNQERHRCSAGTV